MLMQLAEKEDEFAVLRDLLAVTSHLYIFNGCKLRPIKMLDFSFCWHQGTALTQQPPKQDLDQIRFKFMQSLRGYIKLDRIYMNQLLLMLRNLLSLQIGGSIVVNHFQVLVLIIQEQSIPSLRKQVYELLLQTENKKISSAVDQIFNIMLSSEADLLEDNTQAYNIRLAEKGDDRRKARFAEAYYSHYRQCRLLPSTINFIF